MNLHRKVETTIESIIAATKEESVYSKQLRQCEMEVESLKEIIQLKG